MKTIIQYDKILVLKDGEKIEFAAPIDLLNNESGLFRQMVMKQGQTNFDNMVRLAMGRKESEISNP